MNNRLDWIGLNDIYVIMIWGRILFGLWSNEKSTQLTGFCKNTLHEKMRDRHVHSWKFFTISHRFSYWNRRYLPREISEDEECLWISKKEICSRPFLVEVEEEEAISLHTIIQIQMVIFFPRHCLLTEDKVKFVHQTNDLSLLLTKFVEN